MPTSWARKGTVHISVLKIEKNQTFKRATSASAKSSSAEIHGPFKELVGVFTPQRVKSASRYGRVNRHLCISFETLSSFHNSAGTWLEYSHLLGYLYVLRGDPFKLSPFSPNVDKFSSTFILDLVNCGSTRSSPRHPLSLLPPPKVRVNLSILQVPASVFGVPWTSL